VKKQKNNEPPKWKQCADLAALGMTPKEIAFKFNKSTKTIEYHLAVAKKKMGINGWGQDCFILAVVDRQRLDKTDERLTQIEKHLKLALDILLEMRG